MKIATTMARCNNAALPKLSEVVAGSRDTRLFVRSNEDPPMPRFFFNIRDGRYFPDTVGEELPDWHAAREYAVRNAGKILDSEASRLALGEDWSMEVADEKGLTLFRLDFHLNLAPFLPKNRFSRTAWRPFGPARWRGRKRLG